MVILVRNDDLRKNKTSFGILDAQSVQNAGTAGAKGYDTGKKASGIKRHLTAGIMGPPHAPGVSTADTGGCGGALEAIRRNRRRLPGAQNFLADGGYSGGPLALAVKEICGAKVTVVKRNELHTFTVLPKRWIVERSFGWLDKPRRLWKNCERTLHNSGQMVLLAFIAVLIKRF